MSSGDLAVNKIAALKTKVDSSDVVAHAAIFMAVGLQEDVRKLQSANEAELKTTQQDAETMKTHVASVQTDVARIQNDIVKVPRLETWAKENYHAIKELNTRNDDLSVGLRAHEFNTWAMNQNLLNTVNAQAQTVAKLNQKVASQDETIANLNQKVASQDETIATLLSNFQHLRNLVSSMQDNINIDVRTDDGYD
jgi:uncharacterized coiled-coil protein SlyX